MARNASNAIRYSNLVLVIPDGAILARLVARGVLKLTDVAFRTRCVPGTTNRFVPGGADFTQRSFGRVGVRLVGTFGGRIHALGRYKFIAGSRCTLCVAA